ncbi:MAG: patatin-like phospholipase family protein [Myxococcota bacterium]|nr:patatin-like phospholipase family protein [Myxococcota bacterium]
MEAHLDARSQRDHRWPFDELELSVLQRVIRSDGQLDHPDIQALRYVLNFAKLTLLRGEDGTEHDVADLLRTHAWWVRDRLEARLVDEEPTLVSALKILPELVAATQARREELLEKFSLDRESLEREVCQRKLVLVLGGGGGAGYGYAGIFDTLARNEIEPSLICGTSIGALLGLFRARRRRHDARALIEVSKELAWNQVFTVRSEPSRYGLPATLRLHLRQALEQFVLDEDGMPLRFRTLPIPMHIVVTGLTMQALKHELEYYENFLDDTVKPGLVFRVNRVFKIRNLASVLREMMSEPEALKEIVFGLDPLTLDADCLDAAGFSSGIPGLIHYDIHRDDAHMHQLLEGLYAEHGITRLVEGGVVNNVPAKVGFTSAMRGNVGGHRNVFVLAVDCFAPKRSSVLFYPVQQLVRGNVQRNKPYAHHYQTLARTLSPVNLVPATDQFLKANTWANASLSPALPLLKAVLEPFEPLPPAL